MYSIIVFIGMNTANTSTNTSTNATTITRINTKNEQLIRKIIRNLLNYSPETINNLHNVINGNDINLNLLINSIYRSYPTIKMRRRLTRVCDLNILRLQQYNVKRAQGQYLLNEIIYIHNTLLQLQHQQQLHLLPGGGGASVTIPTNVMSSLSMSSMQLPTTTVTIPTTYNYIEPQKYWAHTHIDHHGFHQVIISFT